MADFFSLLIDTNLSTASFVIGAICILISLIGKIGDLINPTIGARISIAILGMTFVYIGVFSGSLSGDLVDNIPPEKPVQTPNSSQAETYEQVIVREGDTLLMFEGKLILDFIDSNCGIVNKLGESGPIYLTLRMPGSAATGISLIEGQQYILNDRINFDIQLLTLSCSGITRPEAELLLWKLDDSIDIDQDTQPLK